MSDPQDDKDRYSALRTGGMLLAIPTLLIVSPLVGFFVGSLLDRWLKTPPWFGILGLVLGFAAAGRETYLIYRRYQQDEAAKEEQKRRR
jgi:F0F1-type ATP synthase assembly protein I